MNRKVMKHLLWKDARTLGPLALAIPVLVLLFFGALSFVSGMSRLDAEAQFSGAYGIWCLLPVLIAYGAPAVLVGGEEESGSLAWLRTLPASWHSIASSKLIVTTLCLMLGWLVASICFVLFWSSIAPEKLDRIPKPDPFYAHLTGNIAMSLVVMLSSFSMAYLFRSPITALILTAPMILCCLVFVFATTFSIAPMSPIQTAETNIPPATQLAFALVCGLVIVVLFLLHQRIAHRRLSRSSGPTRSSIGSAATDAFRPPKDPTDPYRSVSAWYGSAVSFGRPPKWYALLFQHLRQMGWQFWLLSFMAGIGAISIAAQPGFATAVGAIALLSIGSLSFYGDSVKQRCKFFADRGVSPTLVWVTRIVPTLFVTAATTTLVTVVVLLMSLDSVSEGVSLSLRLAIGVLAVFSLAQFISQWSPRPVLTFFATPVFGAFAAFAFTPLFRYYPSSFPVLSLSGLILLFATWQLTSRWMSMDLVRRWHRPYAVYGIAALLIPYIIVLGVRWAAAPWADSKWQESVAIRSIETSGRYDQVALLDSAYLRKIDDQVQRFGSRALIPEHFEELLVLELEDQDSIGEHVSMRQLRDVCTLGFPSDYGPEIPLDVGMDASLSEKWNREHADELASWEDRVDRIYAKSISVLQKWSRITRQKAIEGTASQNQLYGIAETADFFASQYLLSYAQWDHRLPAVEQLFLEIPSQSDIDLARRNSLIRDWRQARSKTVDRRRFAGRFCTAPSTDRWWLGVERFRANRYFDRAVQTILREWKSGTDRMPEAKIEEVHQLLVEAYLETEAPESYGVSPLTTRLRQSAMTDHRFAEIRRMRSN